MKLPNIAGLVGVGKAFVAANRPEILFGTSIVTTVAGMVASARAGYKSGQQVLIEEMEIDTSLDYKVKELSVKEKAQLTWINYLPSAGIGAAALGATTGLHIVHVKEKKALAATALLAIEEVKKQANEYAEDIRASVEENVKLTDKKRDAINESIIEKKADRNGGIALVSNGDGEIEELYLVRDAKTQRDKWTNKQNIEEALLEVNRRLAKDGDCSLNTFYAFAGFNDVPDGEDIGWSGEEVTLKWEQGVRDDGRPVRAFIFQPAPKSGV